MNKLLTVSALFFGVSSTPVRAVSAPRPPAAAGSFYPADPGEIEKKVEALFKREAVEPSSGVVAVLVPHAAWDYSGKAAARAYSALPDGAFDTVIVLGTGHYKPLETAAIYPGRYATPQGPVAYDEALARELARQTPLIVFDASAHRQEHSIEVELPFLSRKLGDFKLVAMVMNASDLGKARAIGHALARVVARHPRTLIVASSDLSHYPSASVAETVDATTVAALEKVDPLFFWKTNRIIAGRHLPNLAVSYCGEGAVTAVLAAARELGATKARVLARYHSGDVTGERRRVVGYASALFLKDAAKP